MGFSQLNTSRFEAILSRKGRRTLRGYKTFVDPSGLVHVVPVERRRVSPLWPFFLIVVGLVFPFKALAMMNVGLNDYEAQVSALKSGDVTAKAAWWVLQVDPVSHWIYDAIDPILDETTQTKT